MRGSPKCVRMRLSQTLLLLATPPPAAPALLVVLKPIAPKLGINPLAGDMQSHRPQIELEMSAELAVGETDAKADERDRQHLQKEIDDIQRFPVSRTVPGLAVEKM